MLGTLRYDEGDGKRGLIYIFQDDVISRYAIGCDEEEVICRGRCVDVADLTLREKLEVRNIRVDQGSSGSHGSGEASIPSLRLESCASRRLDEYALQFKLVVQAESICPTLGGRRSTPAHSGFPIR